MVENQVENQVENHVENQEPSIKFRYYMKKNLKKKLLE